MKRLITCNKLQLNCVYFVNYVYKYRANQLSWPMADRNLVKIRPQGAALLFSLNCGVLLAALDTHDVDACFALGLALGSTVQSVLGGNEEGQDKEAAWRQDGDEQGVVRAVQLHLPACGPTS
mgnify:CR=1 FL=1